MSYHELPPPGNVFELGGPRSLLPDVDDSSSDSEDSIDSCTEKGFPTIRHKKNLDNAGFTTASSPSNPQPPSLINPEQDLRSRKYLTSEIARYATTSRRPRQWASPRSNGTFPEIEALIKKLPNLASTPDHLPAYSSDYHQMIDYVIVTNYILIARMEYILERGSEKGYREKIYEAPSGKMTSEREALEIFGSIIENLKGGGVWMGRRREVWDEVASACLLDELRIRGLLG